jgi:hypothetical protein
VRKESPFKEVLFMICGACKEKSGSLKFRGEDMPVMKFWRFEFGTYGIKMKYVNYEGGE